jgi:hypothetical protein
MEGDHPQVAHHDGNAHGGGQAVPVTEPDEESVAPLEQVGRSLVVPILSRNEAQSVERPRDAEVVAELAPELEALLEYGSPSAKSPCMAASLAAA